LDKQRISASQHSDELMKAWRSIIVVISLGQIAAGVACLVSAAIPDAGVFGFVLCTAVASLGLLTQRTGFLRPTAVAANVTLALLFMPAFINRIVLWLDGSARSPGAVPGITSDLIAAGMVFGGLLSARALSRLSIEPAAQAERPALAARG
jgi:hypothetical protein